MNWSIYASNLVLQTILWFQFFHQISRKPLVVMYYTDEQIKNLMSVMHNFMCLVMILCYHWTCWSEIIPLMCVWSQSYYLFDSFNYHQRKEKCLMICHHVGSVISELFLLILCYEPQNINGLGVLWGFFFCELSNYPLYYITHYKNRVPGEVNGVHKNWYLVEGLGFFILRGTVGCYYLFINPVTIRLLWILMCSFWVMSLYWGVLMIKKFIRISPPVENNKKYV